MRVHLHVDLHLLVGCLCTGRHTYSPATSSIFLIVADATSYQTTPPVQRQHNSPYTCNASPPYMNSPELHDHERKLKVRFLFPLALSRNSSLPVTHLNCSRRLTHLSSWTHLTRTHVHTLMTAHNFAISTLHPRTLISMISSVSQLRHIHINDHQNLADNPVALL